MSWEQRGVENPASLEESFCSSMITQKSMLISAPIIFSFSCICHVCFLFIAEEIIIVWIIKVSERHWLPHTHFPGGQRKQPPQNMFWSNCSHVPLEGLDQKDWWQHWYVLDPEVTQVSPEKEVVFWLSYYSESRKKPNILVLRRVIQTASVYPGHLPPRRGQWRANTEISLQQPSSIKST